MAVFKPSDEEPFMVNNPKLHRAPAGSTADGLRRGVQPGEGAVREARPACTRGLAAYHTAAVPACVAATRASRLCILPAPGS